MRIEQFLYLVEVANCRSISIAAQNLYTTQPNISKALKALENELNLTLFTRQKNAIVLTQDGQAILEDARTILKQRDLLQGYALARQQQAGTPLQGALKIIYPPQIRMLLSDVFGEFHARHSAVTLHLLIYETSQLLDSLSKLSADIYFVNVNSIDQAAQKRLADFHSDRSTLSFLFSERLYLLTAYNQPWAFHKELSLKDLADIPLGCVKNENGSSDFLNLYLTEKYHCTFSLTTNESDILLQKVLSGHCSALVTPTSLSEDYGRRGKVIPITDNITKSVYIATTTDPAKQALTRAFTQTLQEQLNKRRLSNAY